MSCSRSLWIGNVWWFLAGCAWHNFQCGEESSSTVCHVLLRVSSSISLLLIYQPVSWQTSCIQNSNFHGQNESTWWVRCFGGRSNLMNHSHHSHIWDEPLQTSSNIPAILLFTSHLVLGVSWITCRPLKPLMPIIWCNKAVLSAGLEKDLPFPKQVQEVGLGSHGWWAMDGDVTSRCVFKLGWNQ